MKVTGVDPCARLPTILRKWGFHFLSGCAVSIWDHTGIWWYVYSYMIWEALHCKFLFLSFCVNGELGLLCVRCNLRTAGLNFVGEDGRYSNCQAFKKITGWWFDVSLDMMLIMRGVPVKEANITVSMQPGSCFGPDRFHLVARGLGDVGDDLVVQQKPTMSQSQQTRDWRSPIGGAGWKGVAGVHQIQSRLSG